MVKIMYDPGDGKKFEVEVTEEFAAGYAKFLEDEQRREWRDKWRQRRHVSLDARMAADWDIADPNVKDPLDILIEKEESQFELPMFTNLTEYQQRVAHKFFVEYKSHEQIAKEEGVSQPAITKLIGKIQKKIFALFD